MNTKSTLWHLNLNDFEKGCIVAVLTAIIGGIQQALVGHGLNILNYDWGGIVNLGIIAGMAYLSKNWMTNSYGAFLGSEN